MNLFNSLFNFTALFVLRRKPVDKMITNLKIYKYLLWLSNTIQLKQCNLTVQEPAASEMLHPFCKVIFVLLNTDTAKIGKVKVYQVFSDAFINNSNNDFQRWIQKKLKLYTVKKNTYK